MSMELCAAHVTRHIHVPAVPIKMLTPSILLGLSVPSVLLDLSKLPVLLEVLMFSMPPEEFCPDGIPASSRGDNATGATLRRRFLWGCPSPPLSQKVLTPTMPLKRLVLPVSLDLSMQPVPT
jgi:hypothetical protein